MDKIKRIKKLPDNVKFVGKDMFGGCVYMNSKCYFRVSSVRISNRLVTLIYRKSCI